MVDLGPPSCRAGALRTRPPTLYGCNPFTLAPFLRRFLRGLHQLGVLRVLALHATAHPIRPQLFHPAPFLRRFLRGLHQLGVLEKCSHCCGVSGGSVAAALLAFSPTELDALLAMDRVPTPADSAPNYTGTAGLERLTGTPTPPPPPRHSRVPIVEPSFLPPLVFRSGR